MSSKYKVGEDYLNNNPVRSGLVWEAWHYKYGSTIDYITNEKG